MVARRKLAWVVLFLSIAGCGHEDLGPVPILSDLTIENPSVAVGSPTQVTGSMSYQDGDGDVASLYIRVTTPDRQSQTIGPSPASGVSGRRAGTLGFGFALSVESAGDYVLELWVVDARDNESNRLSGTVTAH